MIDEIWPAGSLKYEDAEGKIHIATPNSPMFSTVTMLATHYWNDETGWQPIFGDEDDEE